MPEERLNSISFLYIKNITRLSHEGSKGIFSPNKRQRRKVLPQYARPLTNSTIIFLYCVIFVVFFSFKNLYSWLFFLFSHLNKGPLSIPTFVFAISYFPIKWVLQHGLRFCSHKTWAQPWSTPAVLDSLLWSNGRTLLPPSLYHIRGQCPLHTRP